MSQRPSPQKRAANISIEDRDPKAKLRAIGGSQFDSVNEWLMNQVVGSLHLPACHSQEERDKSASRAVAAMIGLAPKDEVEGMLCAQMVATNAVAMELLRRAMIEDQGFEVQMGYLSMANKLSRTAATLSETLLRKRTGGQQRIVVERVQVAPGGQAVLGDVHNSLGGGRAQEKATQSHEHETPAGRLTAASESPLQGAIETDQAKMRSASRTG